MSRWLLQKSSFASNLENTLALVGDLIQGWGLVVLPDDGFVEVSGIKACVEGSIWLLGVYQGGQPFNWLHDGGDNSLVNHML